MGHIIGSVISTEGLDTSKLQPIVVSIDQSRDELESLRVFVPTDNGQYEIIAASSSGEVGEIGNQVQASIARERKQSIATLLPSREGKPYRVWSIVTPIVIEGQIAAFVSADVSLLDADNAISDTLNQSLLLLVLVIFVIMLLLLNHFRFVQYASLFRKLKEVDQLKTDFLSVATHELRAPMTVIRGSIDNVIDGIFGDIPEKAKESLKTSAQQTERLTNLVNDLLNVSRIEQGKISFNLTEVDASKMVNFVTNQFTKRAAEKNMKIEVRVPDTPLFITADEGRYQEILTNLIDNAIKYSERGEVTVSLSEEEGMVTTSVRDTGIGMNSEARERLFTRFYRVQNDKTRNIGGTGLGLWIIKQYVEKMDGKIIVESMEGVGTEFRVRLPRATSAHDSKVEQIV